MRYNYYPRNGKCLVYDEVVPWNLWKGSQPYPLSRWGVFESESVCVVTDEKGTDRWTL